MCYCIHIRMTLGEGGGDQPPPSNAWSGLLILDMFQEGLKEQITEAVVLAPREANPILWMMIKQGRAPLGKCQGLRIQVDGPHQLGHYGSSGIGDCKYCTGRSPSHCKSCCGKED